MNRPAFSGYLCAKAQAIGLNLTQVALQPMATSGAALLRAVAAIAVELPDAGDRYVAHAASDLESGDDSVIRRLRLTKSDWAEVGVKHPADAILGLRRTQQGPALPHAASAPVLEVAP